MPPRAEGTRVAVRVTGSTSPPSSRRGQRARSEQGGRRRWISIVGFTVGLAVMLYPVFSQWYYANTARQEVKDFDASSRKLDQAQIEKRLELARAYNKTLDPSRLADPYTKREREGRAAYARMLELNEMLGHIEVPRIGEDLPIYAGTSEKVLQKGAGHLEGTSLPIGGIETHAVITAHRGLPNARLFSDLDKMQVGDIFYMHNFAETLAYRVDKIQTVEPSNFSPVLVQPGHDYMTLLTCTPYMINSHRLLVRGVRIPLPEKPAKTTAKQHLLPKGYVLVFAAAGLGVVGWVGWILWRRKKKPLPPPRRKAARRG